MIDRNVSDAAPNPSGWNEALRALLKRPDIGDKAKLAYVVLYDQAGWKPGVVRITAAELAGLIGRSDRAARKWLDDLYAKSLVERIDNQAGLFSLYVYEPEAIDKPRRVAADPQQELPLEPDDAADLSAPKGPGLSAPKSPPTIPLNAAQRVAYQNLADEKPPPRPDLSAQKGPPLPMNHRKEIIKSPISHRQSDSMNEPTTIGDAAVEFAQTFDRMQRDAQKDKAKLAEQIKAFCDARTKSANSMDCSVARRAAELVIIGDADGRRVSRDRLDELISDIRRKWDDGTLNNAGGYFQTRFKKLCTAAGATWPEKRPID